MSTKAHTPQAVKDTTEIETKAPWGAILGSAELTVEARPRAIGR